MAKLVVVTRGGREIVLDGQEGVSVLQILRDEGEDELEALCGGNCACATCHIYVDEAWAGKIETMNEGEDDLLDETDHRNKSSRLACQVKFNKKLDGLRIVIAPED